MNYIQLDSEDIIRDCIDYAHPGYIEAPGLSAPFPEGINAGWYRWDGTNATLDANLKSASINEIVKKASEEAADAAVLDMLERSIL